MNLLSGLATSTALATAQADLDTLTGTDGATLATSQPNYAPNTTTPPTTGEITDAIEALSSFKNILAQSSGKCTRSGDAFTFYDTDGTTPLFTLTYASASRTPS